MLRALMVLAADTGWSRPWVVVCFSWHAGRWFLPQRAFRPGGVRGCGRLCSHFVFLGLFFAPRCIISCLRLVWTGVLRCGEGSGWPRLPGKCVVPLKPPKKIPPPAMTGRVTQFQDPIISWDVCVCGGGVQKQDCAFLMGNISVDFWLRFAASTWFVLRPSCHAK